MAERYFYSVKDIKAAEPRSKPYKMRGESGLYLLVHPEREADKLCKKVWKYDYNYAGRRKTLTIGEWGDKSGQVSLAEARKRRDSARAMVADGIDPSQQRKDEKYARIEEHSQTFESIAREWYAQQDWAPKHAKNIMSRLEKDVFKVIGHKPITQVKPKDIIGILKTIEKRGALDVARRINQYCVAIFDYAINLDICENNPAIGRSKVVKSYEPKNRKHLKPHEVTELYEALHADEHWHPNKLAVWLLALTFLRPSELRGARWEEFDFNEKLWTIPAERMKKKKGQPRREHVVPLSRQAIEVLMQLKELSGDNSILFQGQKRYGVPITLECLIKNVKKYTNGKATAHGFRHTASTVLNEHGFNKDHVEKQLAHVEDNKSRGTYNKAEYLEQRIPMMQWWADYLEGKAEKNSTVIHAKFR